MASAKGSLARDGTMKATAKAAMAYLYPRGQDKLGPYFSTKTDQDLLKSQGLMQASSAAGASKSSLQRDGTMAQTAKEARGILGKSKLGDTRQETAKNSAKAGKPSLKRGSTMAKTVEEAKYVLGGKAVDMTEGRKTRSGGRRAPPKPAVKRAGTMQKTAKEGKSYLKRSKGKGKK